jgi:D-xylose reductase
MNIALLREILIFAKVKPTVLQVELHPYNTQERLLRFCKEKEIAVTGFSNLGAMSYVEMGMAKAEDTVITEAVVGEIAAKHGKTAAQVILRWGVQRGTAIIPKSTKTERQLENIGLFDFSLEQSEMDQISALNKNRRFNDPGFFCEVAFSTFYPIYE